MKSSFKRTIHINAALLYFRARAARALSLLVVLLLIFCAQACMFNRTTISKPLTPTEYLKAAEFIRPVSGFENLRFGMTEKDALKHLPWGLTDKDLPLTWNPENAGIRFVYGEEIGPRKWGIIKRYSFAPEAKMYFVLGFTDKGLETICIALPARAVKELVFNEILEGIGKKYGSRMKRDELGPDAIVDQWLISRVDAEIFVSKPKDNDGLIYILFATHNGEMLLSSVMDTSLKNASKPKP